MISKDKSNKEGINKKSEKGGLRKWSALVLFVLSLLLLVLPRISESFANWYSRNLYPLWQGSLGRLAGLLPFSLSEAILYSLPLLLVLDLFVNRKRLIKVLNHAVFLALVLFFLYEANCGVNYYRDRFTQEENMEIKTQFTGQELYDFCVFAIEGIKENQKDYPHGSLLAEEARTAMIGLSFHFPSLQGFYPMPKALINSRPFTKMEVTGIYSPFTIEANYNRELPGYELPYTACHELSHLRGYMDEGEANFIGWLACLNSENEAFRRSAYMIAWIYGGNALNKENPALRNQLRDTIPQEALDEFEESREFWKTHESPAAEVQDKINDAYLKSNGIKEGIRSYDGVLALMLSWYTSQE